MFDLNLNNITFVPGIDEHGVKKTSHDVLTEILTCSGMVGVNLIKLKLSKINLRNEEVIT